MKRSTRYMCAVLASAIGCMILPVRAGDCESGYSINAVLADGKVIKLDDGSVWEIDPSDISDTASWTAGDEIVVCSDQLVNTDEDETVDATRIK